jgi:hypothetical protein
VLIFFYKIIIYNFAFSHFAPFLKIVVVFFSTGITMALKNDCFKELLVIIALPFQLLLLLLPQPPFLLIYQSQLKTKKFGNRETCKHFTFHF